MSLLMRCERSPTPASVALNTLCPPFSRTPPTPPPHHPPSPAPRAGCGRRGHILGGPADPQAGFMRIPPQFLDELRARLPVSEVVGRRVRLKKAGREWKGLSPFNKEKTPSFFVNDQKMAWFDFS